MSYRRPPPTCHHPAQIESILGREHSICAPAISAQPFQEHPLNILILSPHRDDAAFSLALAMKRWLAAGHRVIILGVFTRSLSAPFSDAETVHPNDLLSYVSAMRRREDAELLKLMPRLEMVDLNLKDAPLRLRCSADELYTLPVNPEDTAIAKIQKALAKLSAQQSIDAILIPLALGHHIDHIVVRNAALAFANRHPIAFYEDLPDAFSSADTADTIDKSVQTELAVLRESGLFEESASPIIVRAEDAADGAPKIKRQIVSVYASQIDGSTIDAISTFTQNYSGGERVWANPAWLASGP